MKINLLLICILFFSGIAPCLRSKAQTSQPQPSEPLTNTYILDLHDIRDETGHEYEYYINALQNHVIVPEVLPSSRDTNDLWGPAKNGLQLSIRFRKREYSDDEVVPVISILRNLEEYPQQLLLTNSTYSYLTFIARYQTNQTVVERPERKLPEIAYTEGGSVQASARGLFSWTWNSKSEKEIVPNLNRLFDLSRPGEYSVQAVCWVYSPDTRLPLFKVSSGTASLRIVASPAPSKK